MSLAIIKDYEPIELMYIEIFEKDPENKDPKSFRHVILPYINSLTIFKDKTKYITRIDISTQNKFFITLRTNDKKIVHYKNSVIFNEPKPFIKAFIRNMVLGRETYKFYGTTAVQELQFDVEIPLYLSYDEILESDCIRAVEYNEYCTTMMRYIDLLNSYTNRNDKNSQMVSDLTEKKSKIREAELKDILNLVAQKKRLETTYTENENKITVSTFLCIGFIIFIIWYYITRFF